MPGKRNGSDEFCGVLIWEISARSTVLAGYRGYRDTSNRASPAFHMNASIFLQRKEWRGEIPVDRAYMGP